MELLFDCICFWFDSAAADTLKSVLGAHPQTFIGRLHGILVSQSAFSVSSLHVHELFWSDSLLLWLHSSRVRLLGRACEVLLLD